MNIEAGVVHVAISHPRLDLDAGAHARALEARFERADGCVRSRLVLARKDRQDRCGHALEFGKEFRYGRTTIQLTIRSPNPKKKSSYRYRVLVSTDMQAEMATILSDYDARGGVPESSFCQSNQGLAQRKRRKHKFVAQQMLTLLSQLAHNLVIWLKRWTTDALQRQATTEKKAGSDSLVQPLELAIKTISGFGIKRFVRQILGLSGTVIIKGSQVKRLVLHRLYPMIELTVRVIENGKVEFPNRSDAASTLGKLNPMVDAKH